MTLRAGDRSNTRRGTFQVEAGGRGALRRHAIQRARYLAEDGRQRVTDSGQTGDQTEGDKGGDQTILDRGGAGLVLRECVERRQHGMVSLVNKQ